MPLFPSDEWVREWVELANGSAEFEASGAGWDGAVGAVVEADPKRGVPTTLYLRLDGREGKWLGHELGTSPAVVESAVFTLRAPYWRWKQLVGQDLNPLKAVLQGKLRVSGHAPAILRRVSSLTILMRLAGELETTFVDEVARGSSQRPG